MIIFLEAKFKGPKKGTVITQTPNKLARVLVSHLSVTNANVGKPKATLI